MNGKLIVIEGLDGSGKGTQAALLFESLTKAGVPVRKVSFPDYDSDSSALVKLYLSGAFGSRPDDVNAYAASTFFAVDRFASFKTDWGRFYSEGGVIISDRYTTSNAVHQCSKLPREQWDEFLNWLFSLEYDLMGIPSPDAVIYLNVDIAVSQRLMSERYQGHEEKKDIHEKDLSYLHKSQEAADYCAKRLGWETVECVRDNEMRSVEDIHNELTAYIRRFLE